MHSQFHFAHIYDTMRTLRISADTDRARKIEMAQRVLHIAHIHIPHAGRGDYNENTEKFRRDKTMCNNNSKRWTNRVGATCVLTNE